MVTFEKFKKQPTKTILGTVGTALVVGDIVKFKPSEGAVIKFAANVSADETYADIQTAIASGYEIYIVAQGDNITYKIPTDYKEYNINRGVSTSGSAKPVVCYEVKNASNIIISDDELTAGYAITFASGDHYTVTAKKNNNSITSGTKVDGNDTVVFTITPASGYQIASVTNNGTTVTSAVVIDTGVTNVGTYTLTEIAAAVTLAVTVEAIVVSSIAITTQPTTTTYIEGQSFDPTGMVVTATYSDTHTAAVTEYTYAPTGALETTDNKITVSYDGKSADVSITVVARVVESIAITTQPTKVAYTEGETFDPAGMVVTATYNDNNTETVNDYTYSPTTALATTDTTITITYSEKTTTVSITVTG